MKSAEKRQWSDLELDAFHASARIFGTGQVARPCRTKGQPPSARLEPVERHRESGSGSGKRRPHGSDRCGPPRRVDRRRRLFHNSMGPCHKVPSPSLLMGLQTGTIPKILFARQADIHKISPRKKSGPLIAEILRLHLMPTRASLIIFLNPSWHFR